MYRSCIFCSAPLGSNESIERFPVGRSLAFDAARGRLWAVCPKCARWNLAPIEERWEAVEDAERLFRDTRLRAQRENIGLARLPDGPRLVRVGEALPGELAVWRYGETLARRRRRFLLRAGSVTAAGVGVVAAGVVAGVGALVAWSSAQAAVQTAASAVRRRGVVLEARAHDGSRVRVQRRHLARARLAENDGEVELHLPPLTGDRRFVSAEAPLVLRGVDARLALGRAMVDLNRVGASRRGIERALQELQRVGSPGEFLRSVARRRPLLNEDLVFSPEQMETMRGLVQPGSFSFRDMVVELGAMPVALEMALHEETERRALEGELAMLEAMWRQAEEIAAIADRLPDVPAPEPPRLEGIGNRE
jgi:hypothetical protein